MTAEPRVIRSTGRPLPPAVGGTPARRRQPLLWRLQSLLVAYVPLLVMALLALFTWWLVKNTPEMEPPREKAAPRHIPDYAMQGFESRRFGVDGRLRAELHGRELRHYPDTDTVEIDGVQLRASGDKGELTLAQGQRALANGDGSEVQMMGGVTVRRFTRDDQGRLSERPSLELRSEFLHAFVNEEKLRSHLPSTLYAIGGELQLQSFEYDNLSGQLRFAGKTRGRFEPRATTPRGGKKKP